MNFLGFLEPFWKFINIIILLQFLKIYNNFLIFFEFYSATILLKLYNFVLKNNVKKYYYGTQIIKEALGAHM